MERKSWYERLKNSPYGLNQSLRTWYKKFDTLIGNWIHKEKTGSMCVFQNSW